MKILFVSRGYPTTKYALNGIFEFDQARALAARGHEVIFAAVDLRSIRRWRRWGRESLVKDGVKIEALNIPLGRFPDWILHNFGIVGLKCLYRECLRKYGKLDVAHAHFTGLAYTTVKAFHNKQLPIIMTEHSSAISEARLSESLINTARYTYDNVNEIVAVSPGLKNAISKKFGYHSKYIPNMIELETFGFEDAFKSSAHFKMVSIGGLIPRKGMDILIKQFAKFKAIVADSSLEIFGDGPERKKLELLIESLNMEDSIKLNGLCPRQTIAAALKKSDVFVLASRNETFGVVYTEALSCGVPVIATICGGPEAFVHKGNGILIPVDDEKALLDAMKTMYRNKDRYDRKQIAAEIAKKFSPDAVASQLEEVYRKVIDKAK